MTRTKFEILIGGQKFSPVDNNDSPIKFGNKHRMAGDYITLVAGGTQEPKQIAINKTIYTARTWKDLFYLLKDSQAI